MTERRVVVTGMGMVSPLGLDLPTSWQGLLARRSGISQLPSNINERIPQVKVAARVGEDFDPKTFLSTKDQRRLARSMQFAVKAADEALLDAGLLQEEHKIIDGIDLTRFGTKIGTGVGGAADLVDIGRSMNEGKRILPGDALHIFVERVSTVPAMRYGLQGSVDTPSAACATGNVAIVGGYEKIMLDQADIMLVGGAESTTKPEVLAAFNSLGALSLAGKPEEACLPFDKRRSGFVFGEGAGILVLEEYEHARKRGVEIYAEVVGYSQLGDGNPQGDTAPNLEGMTRAIIEARRKTGELPDSGVVYVNAHATGTPVGDIIEIKAIKEAFADVSDQVWVSSTKGNTGHMLGAAGAAESIFAIQALRENSMPSTYGLKDPADEAAGVNLVQDRPMEADIQMVVNNSFGFGGINCVTVFRRI